MSRAVALGLCHRGLVDMIRLWGRATPLCLGAGRRKKRQLLAAKTDAMVTPSDLTYWMVSEDPPDRL